MEKAELIEKINAVLVEEFEVEPETITPDADIKRTLKLDSLSLVDMVALIESEFKVKIAVCMTPIDQDTEPQAIKQADVRIARLGVKPWERDTSFIVDGTTHAKKLTIGEAYVTPGNWAGFPPHKHDVDNMPAECVAEEIYYFLFDPPQGFGVQCLYTADGSIDEAYRVKNDELVEFPCGYHTTVSAPGYNTYFLWLMAGDHQGFCRTNDPAHAWVSAVENLIKKS